MYMWLMPLVLFSFVPPPLRVAAQSSSCPEPSHISCGGQPCRPTRDSTRAGACCRDSCGKPTLISEIVHLSRIKRYEGATCQSSDENVMIGCSMCVCKYSRWECVYKDCKACLAIDSHNNTVRYRHRDQFMAGCLLCTCLDGVVECKHNYCGSCEHRGNTTMSGEQKVFGCGTCKCFDGQWLCSEECHQASSSQEKPTPSLFLLPLLLLPSLFVIL